MKNNSLKFDASRRGVIAVFTAVMLIVLLGMIAFAVDVGYMNLARTQLQSAADSAALAAVAVSYEDHATVQKVAQAFANYNYVAGRRAQLNAADVEFGTWNAADPNPANRFKVSTTVNNAIRVTVKTNADNGGATPLFFAGVFGKTSQDQSASAVATVNPRDICFVVDLSASMHTDTEPDYSHSVDDLITRIYSDFTYNAIAGQEPSYNIGAPLGKSTLSQLMTPGSTLPNPYRVSSSDASATVSGDTIPDKTKNARQWKAYAWIMDKQIPLEMPAAKPTPNSSNAANFNYWSIYLNYLNPLNTNPSKIGYRSYLKFMMQKGGVNMKPGGTLYTPLSHHSADCPSIPEKVPLVTGTTYYFPPREMPTHAARRAIIAALQTIETHNKDISDPQDRDWVSVISYNAKELGTVIEAPLTTNGVPTAYETAIQKCTKLQACGDFSSNTTTDLGLTAAVDHIKYGGNGLGREHANKIIVLLTDGLPLDYASNQSDIINYRNQHPSSFKGISNYYGGSSYPQDGALMHAAMMQSDNWYLYAAGLGANCDYGFLNRMARLGGTADKDGNAPSGKDDSYQIEENLTEIFNNIITNPKLRLVQ
jgi:Flp pilus assembly protein TadG